MKVKMYTRIALIIIPITMLFSCSGKDNSNEMNKEKSNIATLAAEVSSGRVSELPLGFKFGMTSEEVNDLVKKLEKEHTIRTIYKGEKFEYIRTTKSGVKVEYWLEFSYYENELYCLTLSVMSQDMNVFNAINEDINSTLDSSFVNINTWDEYDIDGKVYRYCFNKWFKENQIVFLRYAIGCDVTYTNAPVDKIISDKRLQQAVNEARERLNNNEESVGTADVQNSSWDGSVYQVKKYLKNNLNDYKSYESIEWSEVEKTSTGYLVRHKFRAKNGFGGYIIENKIFYLDSNGIVTNVTDCN